METGRYSVPSIPMAAILPCSLPRVAESGACRPRHGYQLVHLPSEILQQILRWLPAEARVMLRGACRSLHGLPVGAYEAERLHLARRVWVLANVMFTSSRSAGGRHTLRLCREGESRAISCTNDHRQGDAAHIVSSGALNLLAYTWHSSPRERFFSVIEIVRHFLRMRAAAPEDGVFVVFDGRYNFVGPSYDFQLRDMPGHFMPVTHRLAFAQL